MRTCILPIHRRSSIDDLSSPGMQDWYKRRGGVPRRLCRCSLSREIDSFGNQYSAISYSRKFSQCRCHSTWARRCNPSTGNIAPTRQLSSYSPSRLRRLPLASTGNSAGSKAESLRPRLATANVPEFFRHISLSRAGKSPAPSVQFRTGAPLGSIRDPHVQPTDRAGD